MYVASIAAILMQTWGFKRVIIYHLSGKPRTQLACTHSITNDRFVLSSGVRRKKYWVFQFHLIGLKNFKMLTKFKTHERNISEYRIELTISLNCMCKDVAATLIPGCDHMHESIDYLCSLSGFMFNKWPSIE